ncbi:unnamed protein product (macronuclear) [Paramecium tetraurelia]|uniref:Alpha/beta hydrolase fold-3 domain-containing protein n=1 Tax=Paramecium tetraurelia TaxID=5888 RepID=A0BNP2_PARTE|nr:uncharacterized protein GSPATT00030798001 [Paramecium tetraurelia]CAK60159.1 unnamed protein product [Paramecium tetraurelia]|eukprot:XP_001427557.1 hypothetical protein (macronuclear) [Paramecium tetraurelia strain d4-2]
MQLKISANFVELYLNQTPCGIGPLAALLFGVKMFQESILYVPTVDGQQTSKQNPPNYRSPAARNLKFSPISIKHDSIELKGWFIQQEQSAQAPTLIFFHENAGNLGYRLDYFEKYYYNLKCNIVAVAYRGYDESSGNPNQIGIQKDAIAIVRYVFTNLEIDKNNVFIHGRSLGGAVSIYAANYFQDSKKEKIRAIILENTFTSINDVVNDLVPNLPISHLLFSKNQWRSCDTIKNIKLPILFISSGQDELVSYNHMKRLIELSENSELKREYHIADGDHNGNWMKDEGAYFQNIQSFFQSITN